MERLYEMRKAKRVLLVFVLAILVGPILLSRVSAQAVELPVPREEAFIKINNQPGKYGWDDWNTLNPPYVLYEALNALIGEFLWYDNFATGERYWWLATGTEYSEDRMTWTIHLREGVYYSDGHPFTSEDVEFTIDLILANENTGHHSWMDEWVESVETPDDYTVVINLTKPAVRPIGWPFEPGTWNFLLFLPKHIWEDVDDPVTFKNGPAEGEGYPIHTGPYKLYKVIPESSMVVCVRDDNYWGKDLLKSYGFRWPVPKYYVERWPLASDIEYLNWINGEWDCAAQGVVFPLDIAELGIEKANTSMVGFWDSGTWGLKVNCDDEKYPLNLPEVRWALAYCLDTSTYASLLPSLAGAAANDYYWAPGWGKAAEWDTKIPDLPKYPTTADLDYAAELLDDIGMVDQDADGWREAPDGSEVAWTLQYRSTAEEPSGFYEIVSADIVANMRSIGIDITAKPFPGTTMMENRAVGDFDLSYWVEGTPGSFLQQGDPYPWLSAYHSKYYTPIGEDVTLTQGEEKRWFDPELDTLLDQMEFMTPEEEGYEDLGRQAIKIFMDASPFIPLTTSKATVIWSTKYWTGMPTVENYWIYSPTWGPHFRFVLFAAVPTGATPPVEMTYVWFTETVEAFTGADARTYGPFAEGDYARIPKEDADSLVAEGVASFEAPIPGLSEILSAISDVTTSVDALQTSIGDITDSVSDVSDSLGALTGQMTMLTTGLVVEAIVIIVLAAVILMRRK